MLAVTDLSAYMYCPRKVFLKKVMKIIPPVKDVMVLGSIQHETLDISNQAEESIIKAIISPLNYQDIFMLYKKVYYLNLKNIISAKEKELAQFSLNPDNVFDDVWPKIVLEAQLRAENVFSFIILNKLYGEKLWENLTPKYITETRVSSDKLGIRGIIDKIEVYSDEKFIPLELKTGAMPNFGVWSGHKIQMLAYIFLLREKLNKEINEGILYYLDHKEKRKVVVNPFSENDLKSVINSINNMIKDQELPSIQENKNKCNACNLKEFCHKL